MEYKYHVVWEDDECNDAEKFDSFIEDAAEKGIKLYKCETVGKAIELLKKGNTPPFCAIILDVVSKANGEDVAAKRESFNYAYRKTERFDLPMFVYSGQLGDEDKKKKFKDEINVGNRENQLVEVYNKNNVNEHLKMFDDIIKAAEKLPELCLIKRYNDILGLFDPEKKTEEEKEKEILKWNLLLGLCKYIDGKVDEEHESRGSMYGVEVRNLLEHVFDKMTENGLLPEGLFEISNLPDVSKFIGNKEPAFSNETVPFCVKCALQFCTSMTGSVGHGKTREETQVYLDSKDGGKKYMTRAIVLAAMDIVRWVTSLLDDTRLREKYIAEMEVVNASRENLSEASPEYEGMEGVVEYDEELGVWHVKKCMIRGYNSLTGSHVELKGVTGNTDKKYKETYPYFAKFRKYKS